MFFNLSTFRSLGHSDFTDFRISGLPDFPTPKQLGYFFPAEFAPHEATWLSWPHKEASWPGKIQTIYKPYAQFIKTVAEGEKVRINVNDEEMKAFAEHVLVKENVNMRQVEFFFHPTNDAWCRDHGPAFLINPDKKEKAIVDWGYNAWGNKYPLMIWMM